MFFAEDRMFLEEDRGSPARWEGSWSIGVTHKNYKVAKMPAQQSRAERRRLREKVDSCLAKAKREQRNKNSKPAYSALIDAGVTLASDLQDYRRAKRVYQQARKLCPSNPLAHYNLACLEVRRNRLRHAMPFLCKAVEFGGDEIRQEAKRDSTLTPLRERTDFRNLVGLKVDESAQRNRSSGSFRSGFIMGVVAGILGIAIALYRPISQRFFWSLPEEMQTGQQMEQWLADVLPAARVDTDFIERSSSDPESGANDEVPVYPMREWAERDSQRTATARFRKYDLGSVVLDRGNEELFRTPWERLSDQDREYVRSVVGPKLDKEVKRFRLWSDKTGQHTSRAAFVDFQEGTVVLDREDGSQVRTLLDNLSIDDFDYVNAVLGGALRENIRSSEGAEPPKSRSVSE